MAVKKKVKVKRKAAKKQTTKRGGGAKGGGSNVYDRVRAQREQMKRRGGGQYYRFPKGRSIIRLLPFEHAGSEEIFVENLRHWNLDPSNKGANVQCLGEDCPICNEVSEMTEKNAGKFRKRRNFLANAIVRKSPDHEGKDALVIAQLPVGVYEQLSDFLVGEGSEDCPNALHPKKGRDFKVTRTGESLKTRYVVNAMRNPSALGMDNPEVYDLIDRQEAGRRSLEDVEELALAIKEMV